MLHLITGTPGSGKTLYAVYLIDKQEIQNKNALEYNAKKHEENKKIIEDNDLNHYFNQYTYFSKVSKEYETVYFEDGYFDYFLNKERKENIFLDIRFYNGICQKIKEELDIELKQLKVVRHQYANIDGLKVDNIRDIEIDWLKCPDGSIIFYDEIQLIDEYSNDNKRDEQGIIKYLTVHRHRAFDIYGITQFPRLVNVGYRDVVGLHYHLHRGWGAKSAMVYVWANCREKPNSLGNKWTAEREFRFNYPKRLYEVYESATADTVKLRIPVKFFLILLIPFFGLCMLFFALKGDDKTFFDTIFGSDKKEVKQEEKILNEQETKQEISVICADENNKDLPICKDFKQQVKQEKTPVQNQQKQTVIEQQIQQQQQYAVNQNRFVKYDINKPYDFDASQVEYQILDKPIIVGCMSDANRCQCFSQQGTLIQMSRKDCKRYISGDRPFNYFKQANYNQYNTQYNIASNQSTNMQATNLRSEDAPNYPSQSQILNDGNKIVGETNNDTFFDKEDNKMSYLTRE